MGISNMKFLLVVAFAAFACAEPEADPTFAYSTAGVLPYAYAHHALPYALPVAHVPVVTYAAGCTNDAGALVPCAHGGRKAPANVEEEAVVVEDNPAFGCINNAGALVPCAHPFRRVVPVVVEARPAVVEEEPAVAVEMAYYAHSRK